MAHANLSWLKVLVAVVAGFGLIPVILLSLLGQVRIFYAMGRDGLLPPALSRCSQRFHTPHIGTLVTGRGLRTDRGVLPARPAGRADLDRHADGVCDRVLRRSSSCAGACPMPRARSARRGCR